MKLIWEKKFKTYITVHRFSLQVKLLMLRDFITSFIWLTFFIFLFLIWKILIHFPDLIN